MPDLDVTHLSALLAGRYRVEREIGEGGMATVYLARDERHGRVVAIKVLHPDLAALLGKVRFLAEIRTTASLQHPHIVTLHDSGEAGGYLFYVMPYIEGESLRARLDREIQLPVDDAVQIAHEVAGALAYAHAHGVIHRDIKPENILLQDGHALVADFGISLALQTAGGDRFTQTGISIGTPQYMSPEQATGDKGIDARTDIYSLGVTAYEMLTGELPFQGATTQAVMARVLTQRPTPPQAVRDSVSPQLNTAVLRALARLPADRYKSAGEFARALGATRSGEVIAAPLELPRRTALLRYAGVAALVGIAAFASRWLSRPGGPLLRFGRATEITWEPGVEMMPALSPDGRQVAYAAGDGARSKIYIRPVAGGRAVPLTDDSVAVEAFPRWSHGGSRILYLSNQQVFSAPAGGGAPHQEVPRGGVTTAAWSPDDRQIAYAIGDSLFLRDGSGANRNLAFLYGANLCDWGARNRLACTGGNPWYLMPGIAFGNAAPSWIAIIDPASGRVQSVTDTGSSNTAPVWSRDGRTLFFVSNRDGPRDLFAVEVSGGNSAAPVPVRLTTGLNLNSMSLSADGTRMAYTAIEASYNVWWVPWNRGAPDQSATPVQLTTGHQSVEFFTVSRDGNWIYYDSDLSGNSDLYRMRLPDGLPERLTTDSTDEFAPAISPDGREVAFHSWRDGSRDIFVLPLDGGPLIRVSTTPLQEQQPAWSPDGRSIAAGSQTDPTGLFIWTRQDDGQWARRTIADNGHFPIWSPDGHSLCYATSMLGTGGLRVITVDGGAARTPYDERVAGAPAAEMCTWSADGKTIYFRTHAPDGHVYLMAVAATGGEPHRIYQFGTPQLKSTRYGFRIANDRLYFTLADRQSNVWVMDVRR